MDAQPLRVAVVGASSQVGRPLLALLQAQGVQVWRIAREAAAAGEAVVHVYDAQAGAFTPALPPVDAIICLAPLPFIEVVLDMAVPLAARRIIAFGSTGRFSKVGSTSPLEREFVQQQVRAEQLLAARCEQEGIGWTLLRPTMIYGADADQTVAFIRSVIRRLRFFPLPWGARGKRQPVHVDDLAAACVAALAAPQTLGRAYNLGGGEVLTFPDLVRRVFLADGRRPLVVPVPLGVYRLLLQVARRVRAARFIRPEMLERMYQDLIADNGPAQRDFGYRPRGFMPQGARGRGVTPQPVVPRAEK